MSTDIHMEPSRARYARKVLPGLAAAMLLGLFGAAPRAAAAQDEGKLPQRLPLKRSTPFVKSRSLNIPGKLPAMKATASKKKLDKKKVLAKPKPKPPRQRPPSPAKDTGPSFANLKRAGSKKCRPLPPSARVNFDFKGDIKELVESISKTTCKNFILTNKVRSQKFEIVSPSPITVSEAWRAFLSALEANDFTIIRVGRYHKIIQATDGTRSPVPLKVGRGEAPVEDRMVTVIWKLENGGDVNAVVNYLNIFKSGKGQIHPFQATGTIIATDFGTSISRLERILKEIDQPGGLEELHVVPVQFASATEIADKLTQIFEPQKAAAGGARPQKRVKVRPAKGARKTSESGKPSDTAVSKILADDRTNKLIIISSAAALKSIIEVMRELDVPEDGTDGQIHVLRLKHADAEEMASTLSNLAQGKSGAAAARPRRTAGKKPAASTSAQLFQGEVKITADKPTNSLVITASKSDLSSVKRVVEKLDVARYQVFVEAVIMEVSTSRDTTVGAGWHGGYDPQIGGETTPILFGNTPNSELSSLITSANPLGLASLLGLAGAWRGPTIDGTESIVQGGIPAVGVVLQALQSTNDVNVISSPHLLTMDNEEAEIQVNEKRPFPSGLNIGGGLGGLAGLAGQAGGAAAGALGNLGGLGLGSVSFNREDVGLTLKLKPQINDEDYVRLEIDQELSDVAGIDQVTNQVITSKRSAKTTVVVRSQDSVVIGGLVRERETLDESKTPLLGDIPLLGWLFKRRQRVVEKVNLILVLTPYIIRGPDDFRQVFERKMEERKEFVDRFYGVTEEYRAKIDWNRKRGPLSTYNFKVNNEMSKAENEGPGLPGETIIRGDDDAAPEGDAMPEGDAPADASSPAPDAAITPAETETPPVPPAGGE